MPSRRALFASGARHGAGARFIAPGGCGWAPLYADPETGPADAELRAIRVAPIPERVGQQLELALRQSLNPTGEPIPQRYLLKTTLRTVRQDLGVQTQGLGTRGRLDAFANFALNDIKTNTKLLVRTAPTSPNRSTSSPISTPTSSRENDARTRAVEEMRRDIMIRLTVFLQRRAAEPAAKPVTP